MTATCDDRADANYEATRMNLERLRSFTDTKGQAFQVIELPLPRMRAEFDGQRLPLTYANFYIVNGGSSFRCTATKMMHTRSRCCGPCFHAATSAGSWRAT